MEPPMLESDLEALVEKQRLEFARLFPQFKKSGLPTGSLVENVSKSDNDGGYSNSSDSKEQLNRRVTRKVVQYSKKTTIINNVVKSSIAHGVLVYKGRNNGHKVKIEQIFTTTDDQEFEDDKEIIKGNHHNQRVIGPSLIDVSKKEQNFEPESPKSAVSVPTNTEPSSAIPTPLPLQEPQPQVEETVESSPTLDSSQSDSEALSLVVRLDEKGGSFKQYKLSKSDKAWLSAKELVDTERRYVTKLFLLDKIFREKVQELKDRPITKENMKILFSNLDSLYAFHSKHLLPALEEAIKKWPEEQKIGDVVCRLAPYLKMYSVYTNNYPIASEVFEDLKRRNKSFLAMIHEIQKLPECDNLPLEAQMICPVQRVARYQLLLQQYLDNLSPSHCDRENTQMALEKVKESANHANSFMRKMDKYKDVLEVQEWLGGQMQGLVTPTRELVKKGTLTKISYQTGEFQERQLFLFNDVLLICNTWSFVVNIFKYKLRAILAVENMQILEGDNLETDNTFLVRSNEKSFEFCAKNDQEKAEWMDALWTTVENYENDTFSLSSKHDMDNKYSADSGLSETGSLSSKHSDSGSVNEIYDNKKDSVSDNVDTSTTILEGYLDIKSSKSVNWVKRCFTLKSNGILESRKDKHCTTFARLLLVGSSVTIGHSKQADSDQSKSDISCCTFKLTHPRRIYFFRTSENSDVIRWVAALKLICNSTN